MVLQAEALKAPLVLGHVTARCCQWTKLGTSYDENTLVAKWNGFGKQKKNFFLFCALQKCNL